MSGQRRASNAKPERRLKEQTARALNVTAVEFGSGRIIVDVALRRRRLICPHCSYSSRWRHNTQAQLSTWRALDMGIWQSWSAHGCAA